MTEPRDVEPDRQAEAHADRELEVRPELIKDLDVKGDDAGDVAGGELDLIRGRESLRRQS